MTGNIAVLARGVLAALALVFVPAFGADMQDGAANAQLVIRIENVSDRGGTIRVALYDRASYAGHDQSPVAAITVEARAPETVVTLSNLRRNVYAVKMFQDFFRTGVFVTNRLGYPEEPFGFSNDAIPLLDQPSFDTVKFNLDSEHGTIVVHLRSLP